MSKQSIARLLKSQSMQQYTRLCTPCVRTERTVLVDNLNVRLPFLITRPHTAPPPPPRVAQGRPPLRLGPAVRARPGAGQQGRRPREPEGLLRGRNDHVRKVWAQQKTRVKIDAHSHRFSKANPLCVLAGSQSWALAVIFKFSMLKEANFCLFY